MKRFEYMEALSVEDAVSLLGQHGADACLLAGGTDLLVEMREHIRAPKVVINLKTVPGLTDLNYSPDKGLKVGALVTARELELSETVQLRYPGLWQAVRELGSIQVRNRATLVGNVCRASPSADTLPPLIADGARITMFGPSQERTVPLEEFFTGPGETVLAQNEIVTEINIPSPPEQCGKSYIKHGRRRAMELATVGIAVTLVAKDGKCDNARIVLGAVAPTPIRATEAEALLIAEPVGEALLDALAKVAMEAASPISNVRASAGYRREMVGVLTKRAVMLALENAT